VSSGCTVWGRTPTISCLSCPNFGSLSNLQSGSSFLMHRCGRLRSTPATKCARGTTWSASTDRAIVRGFVEREIAAGIATQSIVLAGFSQGGAIALHLGLRFPQRLAGILALSTYLPLHQSLPQEGAPANRDVPILMCHGQFDPLLPMALGALGCDYLRSLGYPVEWHEYPIQHEVSPEEIHDVSVWLRSQLDQAPRG